MIIENGTDTSSVAYLIIWLHCVWINSIFIPVKFIHILMKAMHLLINFKYFHWGRVVTNPFSQYQAHSYWESRLL